MHRDRQRDDMRKLVIDEEFVTLGRRVGIHLSHHQFDVAASVIDQARREHHESQFRPTTTKDVTLSQLGLPERIVAKLYDSRYRTLADLLACSDADILSIRQLGPATLAEIRSAAERWLSKIAANLSPRIKPAVQAPPKPRQSSVKRDRDTAGRYVAIRPGDPPMR
jgi:hypothetical protein